MWRRAVARGDDTRFCFTPKGASALLNLCKTPPACGWGRNVLLRGGETSYENLVIAQLATATTPPTIKPIRTAIPVATKLQIIFSAIRRLVDGASFDSSSALSASSILPSLARPIFSSSGLIFGCSRGAGESLSIVYFLSASTFGTRRCSRFRP